MSQFSERLNELLNGRVPKKIKKIELAKVLFVTPQTVSRWCNGVITPDRGTIELITKKINDFYGFPIDSPQRFRSEWLACEDNIPTYNFIPAVALEFHNNYKNKQELCLQLEPYIQYFCIKLGYNIDDIIDNKHFLLFVEEYIEIAIKNYFDHINLNHKKEGE